MAKTKPKDEQEAFVRGVAAMKELLARFFEEKRKRIAAAVARAYAQRVEAK